MGMSLGAAGLGWRLMPSFKPMLPCQSKIDLPTRREFLAALFTGMACCRLGQETWAQPMTGLMSPATDGKLSLKLADFPVLASEGGSIGLMYGTDFPVLISRLAEEFVALRGECPHASGTVIPLNGSFFCTNHGSVFDTEGIAFSGPALGTQLPQYTLTHHEASGLLEVTVPNMAHSITVVALSGADRLALTFQSISGAKHEVRFRAQLTGAESVVSFASTPTGSLNVTELSGDGTSKTVYVSRSGQGGFFLVNAKVTQL